MPRLDAAAGERIAAALSDAIGAADIASLLLRWQPGLELGALHSLADRLRTVAQKRDVAVLLEDRADLVRDWGADGVHLSSGTKFDETRRRLEPGFIVGVGCSTRHDAIVAADSGADYVAFGDFDDVAPTDLTLDLTQWWSALTNVPCVASGCSKAVDAERLAAAGANFIAIGVPAWQAKANFPALLRLISAGMIVSAR